MSNRSKVGPLVPSPIESEGFLGGLTIWTEDVASGLADLNQDIARLNTTTTNIINTTPDNTPAGPVTGLSATESGRIIDGVLFSEVTTTYSAPDPIGNFAGIFFVVKNYLGSASLVKLNEHSFSGASGASASFKTELQRTGETVTVYAVSKNFSEVTPEDWTLSPSATVVLDGNASAPNAPTGLAATSAQVGIALSWNNNSEGNLAGYKVYRAATNSFGASTVIANIGVTRTGTPSFFDTTAILEAISYYFVTAINTAGQESSNSIVASAVSGGTGTLSASVQGNFGYTSTANSVTIYWDGTNASTAFTIRIPRGGAISSISVPGSSVTITGLGAGTFYVYGYYDIATNAVLFATGGTGTPTYAFVAKSSDAVSQAQANGHIPLQITAVTIATGGGGGSGGGDGCLCPWTKVLTQRGSLRVDELVLGDMITCPNGWTEIIGLRKPLQTKYVTLMTLGKKILECSPSHPIALPNGKWRRPDELEEGDLIQTKDGPEEVILVSITHEDYISILPTCKPSCEFYSNGILTHNNVAGK